MEEFLDIFCVPLHKINLCEVALLSKERNRSDRRYYKFIGRFEFVPPEFVWDNGCYERLTEDRQNILNKFNSMEEQSAQCIKRKFTRKMRSGGEVKKVDFEFVFDIVPRRIINYEFDASKKKMYLYVVGYGM